MKKAVHFWRWSLIGLCAAISAVMFVYINQSYDPLARYPYASDYNRDIILEHLNSEEIDYMINQQLKPAQFMPFIETEGFNIRNSSFYTAAYEAREAPRGEVVAFVNDYRSYFSLDTMVIYLEHYSYEDLSNFIETQLVLDPDLKLAEDPQYPYLVLDSELSVYKYEPSSLTVWNDIQIQAAMAENLTSMLEDYENVMEDGSRLKVESGYMSYEQILDEHSRLSQTFGSFTPLIYLGAGKNEAQLGYTIALSDQEEWLKLLADNPKLLTGSSADQLLEKADEEMVNKIQWLESNAWKYGFVIRYPKNGQSETGHLWQPFVLRYVGVDNARKMMESNAVMETFDFGN